MILAALLAALLLPAALFADSLRIAVFAAPLSRDGPGLLLRDITDRETQVNASAAIIRAVAPDIVVLTDFDYDARNTALAAFAELAGGYPHVFALRPNSGMATGLDLDGDGRIDARDAQGYGRFAGDGGLALLSRWPVERTAVQDFSTLLWRDMPGATLPQIDGAPFPSEGAQAIQRLSSTGHWAVPVSAPGGRLTVLMHAATPPVFDGPEDRNGLRNRDELLLWRHVLDGTIGRVSDSNLVLAANTNLDPVDGDGHSDAMAAMLADPRLPDPAPRSAGGAANPSAGHAGDPALDTADWAEDGAGNLRVAHVLPSADWRITGAGVHWPRDDPEGLIAASGPHRLVWVDIARPGR